MKVWALRGKERRRSAQAPEQHMDWKHNSTLHGKVRRRRKVKEVGIKGVPCWDSADFLVGYWQCGQNTFWQKSVQEPGGWVINHHPSQQDFNNIPTRAGRGDWDGSTDSIVLFGIQGLDLVPPHFTDADVFYWGKKSPWDCFSTWRTLLNVDPTARLKTRCPGRVGVNYLIDKSLVPEYFYMQSNEDIVRSPGKTKTTIWNYLNSALFHIIERKV